MSSYERYSLHISSELTAASSPCCSISFMHKFKWVFHCFINILWTSHWGMIDIVFVSFISLHYNLNVWCVVGPPFAQNSPLEFCTYSGPSCCTSADDSRLHKQFRAMNISDSACAAIFKSILCAVWIEFINYMHLWMPVESLLSWPEF